ncbi:Anaerobic sulfite reductase subunit B [Anaerohalosphaera lusitana]|uniref:Anaerobic sulfite reductase subunit B n=1 Tax=Anaerohalosphaera lusitana TaxID=1936003 RepID=A0A1U9NLB5_9BACT|nr:FAD/NAD(P)-binding protein [Anaerohalosphaera lusitana]AQT68296.1 Anaerobic sulfite reductase subunit B [Anaerohalosphaera lusitana]
MCDCCSSKKDIYLPELATVKKRKLMNGTELYLLIQLDSGEELGHKPGQFVEVSIAGIGECPISISSSPTQKGGFELVVRNAGSVTKAIHKLKVGDKVGIRGPFGEGYHIDQLKNRNLICICGGLGLAPQRSLINYILDNPSDFGTLTVLLGTKCYPQRFFREELAKWAEGDDMTFKETVDEEHDCWTGNVGVVTTLIPKVESHLKDSAVLVCGPPVMYKFVLMALEEYDIPHDDIYVNLERRMKCGVGKCGHCQINGEYVCQSGPVYRYSEIGAMPEAI